MESEDLTESELQQVLKEAEEKVLEDELAQEKEEEESRQREREKKEAAAAAKQQEKENDNTPSPMLSASTSHSKVTRNGRLSGGLTGLNLVRIQKKFREECPKDADYREKLRIAQQNLFHTLKSPYINKLVDIGDGNILNTTVLYKDSTKSLPPLVMLQGYCAGMGLYIKNLDKISEHFTIYLFDVLGFAGSSHPPFKGKEREDAIEYFVGSMKKWVEKMELDTFFLTGHSLGGHISAIYAMRYPERVRKLILLDPWGISPRIREANVQFLALSEMITRNIFKCPVAIIRKVNSLMGLRAAKQALGVQTKKLLANFDNEPEFKNLMMEYVFYMCINPNCETAGETAFSLLVNGAFYPRQPLEEEITLKLKKNLPLMMLFGDISWIDADHGWQLQKKMPCTSVVGNLRGDHHFFFRELEVLSNFIQLFCLAQKQEDYEKIADYAKEVNVPCSVKIGDDSSS